MLKKEEAIEEGRVKKKLKEKGVQFGAPPGPRGLTGAQEQWSATLWRPGGAHGRHLGPVLQKKLSSRIQGFYTLYKLPNTPKSAPKLSQVKNTKLSQGFHHFLSIPTQIHLIPLQISHHSSLLLPFPLHFYHPPSPTSIFIHGSTLG